MDCCRNLICCRWETAEARREREIDETEAVLNPVLTGIATTAIVVGRIAPSIITEVR